MQRASTMAAADLGVGALGLFESAILGQSDHAVHLRRVLLQARQIHLGEVGRSNAACTDQCAEFGGGPKGEVVYGTEFRMRRLGGSKTRASDIGSCRQETDGRFGVERDRHLAQLNVGVVIAVDARQGHGFLRLGQLNADRAEGVVEHFLGDYLGRRRRP